MRSLGLLLALCHMGVLSARTMPIRRYESNLIPAGIAQGRDGFLWLATADGIVRFDGLHYELLRAPAGIDTSGGEDIEVTPSGSVWLATEHGLILYDHGKFSLELPGRSLRNLIVTPAGRLLVSAADGLFLAAEPDRRPVKWTHAREAAVHGRFQLDAKGNVWFGCGVYVCTWSDSDVRQMAAGDSYLRHRSAPPVDPSSDSSQQLDWADIVSTPDHSIWARNGPNVLVFAGGRYMRHTLPVETFLGVRPGFFLDRRGRLWIPGRQLHVVENGQLEVFRPGGAHLQDVTAMLQDRHGTLWFGLAGKGLAALPDEASLQSWAEPEGISGSVLGLAPHPSLGLTAATNSGAYAFDAARNRWRSLPFAEGTALRGLVARKDGTILSIPYAGGLLQGTHEISLPDNVNRKRMRYLYRDQHDAIWIASVDGLFRLGADQRIKQVSLPGGSAYAADLAGDADGRLWVGYEGGVAICAGDSCTQAIAPEQGLLNPRVRTLAPGKDEVWVGYRTSGGFSRFVQRPGGWTVTQFIPDNGYGPPDTHFLRRDQRGWIWRGSTDGVYVCNGVNTEPEDWLHLTFGDEVNASYANMYAWHEQSDGAVWIGTQKGVVRLRPSAEWFTAGSPRVSAHHEQQFQLARPGLAPFQSRLFRYRLLPSDPSWRLSANGTVRYAKLAAGPYRLQVSAGAGRPPVEYAFSIAGGSWIPWSVGGGIVLAAAVFALARWQKFRRRASAADDYWRQKREFLESRTEKQASAEPPDDWCGRTLDGRFLLERWIAGGGFASVYRGLDQANAGQRVAVKLLHPLRDNEQWRRRRFVEEVSALQKLHDSGIVEIRYAGEAAPDRPYLVMEFIEGVTLRALFNQGQLELDRAAHLLQQAGQALAAAHRANILHRDLKPENIMIRNAGGPAECIKLIDFGIASLIEEQAPEHTTKLAGSPGYLAPERWVGLASCRSDIYSLAAIAAEMLSGAPVTELGFCAGDPVAFRHRILRLRPSLPPAVLDLLSAALAYDPEARPSDAEAFTRDISHNLATAHPTTNLQS